MAIFIKFESLLLEREHRRHVLLSFILEKLQRKLLKVPLSYRLRLPCASL